MMEVTLLVIKVLIKVSKRINLVVINSYKSTESKIIHKGDNRFGYLPFEDLDFRVDLFLHVDENRIDVFGGLWYGHGAQTQDN